MRVYVNSLLTVAMLTSFVLFCPARTKSSHPSSQATYVITNDDGLMVNQTSFYLAGISQGNPTLTLQTTINSGGRGIGGGFFGTPRVKFPADASAECMYVSNGATANIGSIDLHSQQLVGMAAGSRQDIGSTNGIGLALTNNYLYAGFTGSNSIATFAVEPGCQLSFLRDTTVAGLNGGWIGGMAIHGDMLVVAYGDGSIESFNIANGLPMSNDDRQNSAGFSQAYFPESVDITQDGHYAIFGDAAVVTTVEVSDLSSGKLSPTVMYTLGTAVNAVGPGNNSASVWLSPDETLLYIGNSQGGSVTAAFFNTQTGKISPGCFSGVLNGFYNPWAYVGSVVTRDPTGTGGVLYVAEFGSSIGIVEINSNGSTCTLREAPNSPVSDDSSDGLISIQVFPPRPF
jgi:hypothetical protein